MDRLIDGYRNFRAETWPGARARYQALAAQGQRPHTVVVACSDSRVDPQTVFGAGPGELFAIRNVAGLVPPYAPDAFYHGTSAALEYAVRVLRVRRVVVLGHARCGGIQAMVEGVPEEARDFVEPWMDIARPALARVPAGGDLAARLARCETEVLRLTLANLMTFPWIAEPVAAGRLALTAMRFDIHTGTLATLTPNGLVPVA